jgi:hypothetical protein
LSNGEIPASHPPIRAGVIAAAVAIALACPQCPAQVANGPAPKVPASKQPKAVASEVQVTRGKSEIDGTRWTVLSVPATTAYQGWASTIRPRLKVQCEQSGERRSVRIFLESGPVQRRYDQDAYLRVKLDDAAPVELRWTELNDLKTYQYWSGYPDSDGAERDLLEQVFASKAVLVEPKNGS